MIKKALFLLVMAAGLISGCVVVDDGPSAPPPSRHAAFYSHYHYYHHDDMHHGPRRPRPAFDGRPADYPGVKTPTRPKNVMPTRRGLPPTVR